MSTSRSPPRTRSKKGESFDIDAIVEAVVSRLQTPGVLGTAVASSSASAPSCAPASVGEPFGVATVKTEGGPDAEQRRLWLQELRAQLTSSPRFRIRAGTRIGWHTHATNPPAKVAGIVLSSAREST